MKYCIEVVVLVFFIFLYVPILLLTYPGHYYPYLICIRPSKTPFFFPPDADTACVWEYQYKFGFPILDLIPFSR